MGGWNILARPVSNPPPVLVLVAGPNGAGKTTLTQSLNPSLTLVNADTIMLEHGYSPLQAGKVALSQLRECIQQGQSCVYETTLSGKGLLKIVGEARAANFSFELHYVGLDSAELAVGRVNARHMSRQGHMVPEEDVRRRYARSLQNLPLFLAECDHAVFYDNSSSETPLMEVCAFSDGMFHCVDDRLVHAWLRAVMRRMES
jgi:predicted ABC-type ATPase